MGHGTGGHLAGEDYEMTHEMSELSALEYTFKNKLCHSTGAGNFIMSACVAVVGADTPDRASFMCMVCTGMVPLSKGCSNSKNVCPKYD